MGPYAMREVLAVVLDGRSPYDRLSAAGVARASAWSATASSKRRTRPVDWRQWLDIVDEVGLFPAGVPDLQLAQGLLVRYGIAKRSGLQDRADARAGFHALRDLAPDGRTPVVVRRLLDTWDFADAWRAIALAVGIAAQLSATPADGAGLADRWAEYEGATSVRALERLSEALR